MCKRCVQQKFVNRIPFKGEYSRKLVPFKAENKGTRRILRKDVYLCSHCGGQSGGKEENIGVLAKAKRRVTLQNINLTNYWTG